MANSRLPFPEAKAAALNGLGRVLDWAGVRWQPAGHEVQMINPHRSDDSYGSFSINTVSGAWSEFATGDKGGDVVSLVAYLKGYEQGDACRDLAKLFGIMTGEASPAIEAAPVASAKGTTTDTWQPVLPIPAGMMGSIPKRKPKHPGKIVSYWYYRDAAGLPLVAVARLEPGQNGRSKDYFPLSVWLDGDTGKREWRWKNLPAPRPLYGLDQLAARSAAPVVICEGEKAADAAVKLLPDHVAICWMNGAEAVGKADFGPLAERDCLIWPDNDQPGADAAQAVATALRAVGAASVARLDLSGFATFSPSESASELVLVDGGRWDSGDDAADALARGWTARHIELLRDAGPWLVLDADSVDSASCEAVGSASASPELSEDSTKASTKRSKKTAPKRPKAESTGSPFQVTDSGVWFRENDENPLMWVCAKLEILARTRDKNSEGWGLLVRFADPDRNIKDVEHSGRIAGCGRRGRGH